jgi:endogenous inhibitor of DNA gyrase (YacG/DUF329 family)
LECGDLSPLYFLSENETKATTGCRTPNLVLQPRLYFSLLPSYFCLMPKCPECEKPIEWQDNPWRPFCSERCKLIDFGRWADGEYRVPGKEINPDEITNHPEAGEAKGEEDR